MTSRPPAPARWKPAAVLAAVFLFGGVAGAALGHGVTLHHLRATFRRPPAEARAQFRLEAMRRRLDLTDAQESEIEAILAEAELERERLLAECRPGLDALRDGTDARVKGVLTADQRAQYERFEAMRRRRPGPPDGPGHHHRGRGRGPGERRGD
ncbi:hypothetical protein SOCEGT47_079800 [Sorangium cellulosum]|jgi:hypothetical protein|uniref:Periplasmic heavy metal sensor n=1 Tax=Sorangium cellulosum TaxID=56 RepID=A0A4V0NEU5_SORCE|nr:hypothetical protein [Sorangium cellulosum]AUX27392.1 hypothetical protein SOCEGT47_079800 [Sorangium cellulosum]